jgi:alkylation response protein AidB-like acyl-CoA dehydrogenase
MAPMTLGIVEKCLEVATAYSKERVTWGRPIADYQLVQEKMARMYVHRQTSRTCSSSSSGCRRPAAT